MPAKGKNPAKRVLIVDDHPMLRQGLAQLIDNEPDLKVCAEADSAAQAMKVLTGQKVDLVILDISLPDKNGLEVIKDIHVQQVDLPILVVSMHDEALYVERVLRAGARGYLMKQEGGKKLLEAVRQVLSGKISVSEKMSARILESFSGQATQKSRMPMENLSDREFEVLQLLGQGKGTRELAAQLHLSVKTVDAHRANIKRKLNLKTGPELVRYAVRWVETEK